MKKLYIFLALSGLLSLSKAQTRTSLLEEFTGEECLPCAAYNPALDSLLALPANAARLITIKWQVPIPFAPGNTSSLYFTNQNEINWRYRGAGMGGYGYLSQYSPTHTATDGIMNAPSCFIDGKNQWASGAATNHPYYLKNSIIKNAASVATPFTIKMATAWNGSLSNCVVTVTVSSSTAFSAAGSLMFRLCLVERFIEFQFPPGSNGETKFHEAVRKSYPVTTSGGDVTGMGTVLASSWTPGQTQVLTVSCAIPSYIMNKSQMAFVGFIQDDGDQEIYQAARTGQPAMPNDADAGAISIPQVICAASVIPSVTINNMGSNAITSLTITPTVDGVPGTNVTWAGNLASGSATTITMNAIATAAGTHTYAYVISGVSGGDIVTTNNHKALIFQNALVYNPAPLYEDFEGSLFPPSGWIMANGGAPTTFYKNLSAGGHGLSASSVAFRLCDALTGETYGGFLPPADLSGTVNPELSFDLAYQRLAGSNDSLKVLVSSDCGGNWVSVYANGGASMATAPLANDSAFAPLSSEWTNVVVPLAAQGSAGAILIKFQLETGGGNGLFIDNINLKQGSENPAGHHEVIQSDLVFNVYPNPANTMASLVIMSGNSTTLDLELENSLGQIVQFRAVPLSAGENSIALDCRDLPMGIYFVRIKRENGSSIRKLVITK